MSKEAIVTEHGDHDWFLGRHVDPGEKLLKFSTRPAAQQHYPAQYDEPPATLNPNGEVKPAPTTSYSSDQPPARFGPTRFGPSAGGVPSTYSSGAGGAPAPASSYSSYASGGADPRQPPSSDLPPPPDLHEQPATGYGPGTRSQPRSARSQPGPSSPGSGGPPPRGGAAPPGFTPGSSPVEPTSPASTGGDPVPEQTEEDKTHKLRRIKAILNKLSPPKFDSL